MKISESNYKILKDHLSQQVNTLGNRESLYQGESLSPKRCRWDYLWSANVSKWIRSSLYGENDLNDEHIDTALRNIMKDLGLIWAAQK
jgi:hypothetical protein